MKCKYERRRKDHVFCLRDCTVRKKACPCPHYCVASSLWKRIQKMFRKYD